MSRWRQQTTYVAAHLTSGRGSGRYQFWAIGARCLRGPPGSGDRRRRLRGLLGPKRLPGAASPGRSFAVLREHGRAWHSSAWCSSSGSLASRPYRVSAGPRPARRGGALGAGAGDPGGRHRLGGDRLDLGAAGVLRPRGARRGAPHRAGDARPGAAARAHAHMRSTAQERDLLRRRPSRFGLGVATLLVGWAAIWAGGLLFLTEVKLGDSRAAADSGDLAVCRARRARREHAPALGRRSPGFSSPSSKSSAATSEAADRDLGEAIQRAPDNWQLWFVRARLGVKSGDVDAARRALERARQLNPRAPFLAR